MKRTGMLVVSLRGINFGYWYQGCCGQNVIIFSRQGLVYGCTRRNNKKGRILIRRIYSIHINKVFHNINIYSSLYFLFVCILNWSLLGVCISFGHAQVGLFLGSNSKFPTSIPVPSIGESPPPPPPRGSFSSF